MPAYTCPDCKTEIKRSKPVEAGKRLRCPECSAVFAPAAPPPAAPPVRRGDDDDGPANYGLIQEAEDTAEDKAEREKAYGPLKQRFEKGKRGPALEIVVRPSNFLLLAGVLTIVMGITSGVVAIWPMVFKSEETQTKKKGLYDVGEKKTRFRELTPEEYRNRFLWLGASILYCLWGAVICAGASRMHEVETYWLAFTAAAMAILGPVLPLAIWMTLLAYEDPTNAPDQAYFGPAIMFYALGVPVSLWNISTLLKKPVREGFEDTTPIV